MSARRRSEPRTSRLGTRAFALGEAGRWDAVGQLLASPRTLVELWSRSPEDVMELWVRVEGQGSQGPRITYRGWEVDRFVGAPALGAAGHLLYWMGHVNVSERLLARAAVLAEASRDSRTELWAAYWHARLREDCARLDDPEGTYRRLADRARDQGEPAISRFAAGDIALAISARGANQEALGLLRAVETEAREQEDWEALERALSFQASIGHFSGLGGDVTLAANATSLELCHEHRWRVAKQLTLRVRGDIIQRRDPEGALWHYREAERLCRTIGYARGLQAALGDRAGLHAAEGRLELAIGASEERARICRRLDNAKNLQRCLGDLARFSLETEDQESALRFAIERERACREARLRKQLGKALGQLGHIHLRAKRFDASVRCFREQEQIGEELALVKLRRQGLIGLGVAISASGDAGGAADTAREIERYGRQLGGDAGAGAALGDFASDLVDAGRDGDALVPLRTAKRIAEECGSAGSPPATGAGTLAFCLLNLARVHKHLGRLDASLAYFVETERIARTSSDDAILARSLFGQGELLERLARHEAAVTRFREAEHLARGDLNPRKLYLILFRLATNLDKVDRPRDAMLAAMEAASIATERRYRDRDQAVTLLRDLSRRQPIPLGPSTVGQDK